MRDRSPYANQLVGNMPKMDIHSILQMHPRLVEITIESQQLHLSSRPRTNTGCHCVRTMRDKMDQRFFRSYHALPNVAPKLHAFE